MVEKTKEKNDELDQARQKIKELDKMIKVASIAEALRGINSKKTNELNEEWKKRYPNNPVTFDKEWVKEFSMGANKYVRNGKGNIWTQYKNDLIQQRKETEKVVKDHNNAVMKDKVDKWKKASYSQQVERKRWNENKAKEAKKNVKYFRDRMALVVLTNNPNAVFKARKYLGNGKYGPLTYMKSDEYLKHCEREAKRWTKAAKDYDWGAKDAEAKIKAMPIKPKVKGDSEKANKVKKTMKKTNELSEVVVTSTLKTPQVVQDKLTELGNDYKLVTLSDSKGNRIYCFEKDGKHAAVMTHIKGQNPSEYMEVKSNAMKSFVNEAAKQNFEKGADFTNIIGKMKDAANGAEGIGLSDYSKQLNPIPESLPDAKIKITPTVTVVPKIKKNGKPSTKNFNIQLMDADGKVFILDKKMVEKAVKQQGNAATTREEMVDASWKNYVEAAKKGKLPPETIASFFKGQVNLGETNTKADGSTITLNNAEKPIETGSVPPAVVDETTKDNKSLNLALMAQRERQNG